MKIISHQELSQDNRYQAIEVLPSGDKIIAFASTSLKAIEQVLERAFCKHIFTVSNGSRFKNCKKCGFITKEK